MSSAGLVSVIIPCFNARFYIAATLESVFAQEGVRLEVILVDDGSQDESAELVRAQFPQVTVYRTANQGPSSARNFGTRHCDGEFIQYLDADDLLAPCKLQTQLASIRRSKAEVAYGDWLKFRLLPDGTRVVQERFVRQLGPSPEIDLFTGFWCPPAAYLVRRTVVDRVGGWHPHLPVIQDARFMLDCALRGAAFVYCAGLMAEYRMHDTGSVSTRSRIAFLDDCLRNALEVRDWWASRGHLDPERRRAVVDVLDMVANGSVGLNSDLFDRACDAVEVTQHENPPGWPLRKRTAVTLFGYRSAITLAHRLRRSGSVASRGMSPL